MRRHTNLNCKIWYIRATVARVPYTKVLTLLNGTVQIRHHEVGTVQFQMYFKSVRQRFKLEKTDRHGLTRQKCLETVRYSILRFWVPYAWLPTVAKLGSGASTTWPPLSIFQTPRPPLPQLYQDIMTMTCRLTFQETLSNENKIEIKKCKKLAAKAFL